MYVKVTGIEEVGIYINVILKYVTLLRNRDIINSPEVDIMQYLLH